MIGVLLTGSDQPYPHASHRVYAYSLGGAGVGCVVAIDGLTWLGGVGMIAVAALSAMMGAVFFARISEPASGRLSWALSGLSLVLTIIAVAPPSALDMELSQYKALSALRRVPGAEIISTRWSAVS